MTSVENIGNLRQESKCPYCSSPLVRVIEGEIGKRFEFIVCEECKAMFPPAWPEHQWGEPESQPEPLVAYSEDGTPLISVTILRPEPAPAVVPRTVTEAA